MALKQILIGFAAAAIFIGALTVLYPSGNIKKSVQYGFSLTFLCICVSLFCVTLKIDLPNEMPTVSFNDDALVETANTSATALCETFLTEQDIPYKKVRVETNIDDTGGIYINSITVYTSVDEHKVIEVLAKLIDVKRVEVVYE